LVSGEINAKGHISMNAFDQLAALRTLRRFGALTNMEYERTKDDIALAGSHVLMIGPGRRRDDCAAEAVQMQTQIFRALVARSDGSSIPVGPERSRTLGPI
jgi:hypothetical protein